MTDREPEPVTRRDEFARRSYRNPSAVAIQVGVWLVFFALDGFIVWAGIAGLAGGAVLIALTLFLWIRVMRAGVRADVEGVTVRTQFGKLRRFRWADIDRFELAADHEGLPDPWVVLKDGEEFELEPLQGVQLQPRQKRWEWAERSLAGLSAQLHSRGLRGG